jgi:hypothetical protein
MTGKRLYVPLVVAMAAVFTIAMMGVVSAAELVTAELAGTANDVTVTQGSSSNFNIDVSATGAIDCDVDAANPSTATVDTAYSFNSSGTLSTSTPSSSMAFYSNGSAQGGSGNCGTTWTGAPAHFSVPASVSANAATPVGTYTIPLSAAAGTTDETNPADATTGKLGDITATSITVHVVAATPTTQNQTITFGALSNKTYGDADFTVAATASSGLAVSFTASGDCTVSGDSVHITGAGSCTITAHQAGNGSYNPAPDVARSFTIAKAPTTTKVTCSGAPFTYTGSAQTPCSASVTGAGGLDENLDVTYTDNINAGTAGASASYGETANYLASSDSTTFTIDKAPTTTKVTCSGGPFTYTGSAQTPCSASVTGAGGLDENLDVTYTDNTNAGTAGASASYTATPNYLGSSDSTTFTIEKAPTTTKVTCSSGPFTYTGSPQTPCSASVTGAGGLSESLTVLYTNNTNAGTATASASYAATPNYLASSDSRNFTIDKANATCTVTGYTVDFDYAFHTATGSCVGVLGESLSGLNLSGTNHKLAGTYADTWTFTDATGNYKDASGTVTDKINPWTLKGFYQPVDMSGVWNVAKNGSTVPLKFEVFGPTTELTDVAAIDTFTVKGVACPSASAPTDDIEMTTTGGTVLRYDTVAGQFVQNWLTPKKAGACYTVTMTTDDGSKISANFMLK